MCVVSRGWGYSRSKIREVAVKNTTIFVGKIIYQLHVSALIGHLQVGIQRQRKISIISVGMGGTRSRLQMYGVCGRIGVGASIYEGWNSNSGNYLFTTDTK